MITYNILNYKRFEYLSDVDVDVIIDVYVGDNLIRKSEVSIKSGANHFTEIANDYDDKKVVIYDKSTNDKYCEFIMNGTNNILNEFNEFKGVYSDKLTELYIDLLKKSLIDYVDLDNSGDHDKIEGRNLFPSERAKTMVGLKALNNIEYCINEINRYNIDGDFIETGVWRGGATIFMKALSDIFNMNKKVWVADAFELVFPLSEHPDDGDEWQQREWLELKVTLEEVQNNFRKYNVLDENVKFLKGWFKDTLNTPEIDKISLLRLDGDMYSSTMQSLNALYPKLQKGGYIIIDDYFALDECKKAVEDYRKVYNITEDIIRVNWACVYWKKR